MAPEKIKYSFEMGKILAVLLSGITVSGSILFYAGKQDQRVTTLESDVKEIKTYIYPQNIDQMNKARAYYNKSIQVKE